MFYGGHMPEMTLTEAAKWAGVGRPTIHKALTGKLPNRQLSGRKDENGHWFVDPAELARVFKPASAKAIEATVAVSPPGIQQVIEGNSRETALLREMLDEVRRERDDLRKDRDHWRDQAEQQTLMLTHQRQQPAATSNVITPASVSARPGFFARLKAVVVPPARA